jgi:hypothetical protein
MHDIVAQYAREKLLAGCELPFMCGPCELGQKCTACPGALRTVAAACFLRACDRTGCPNSGAARVGGRFALAVAPVAG